MTDKLIDHIREKGNHTFKIDSNEMKSCCSAFEWLHSRRSMYWEMYLDSGNTIVASLFTRNRFLNVLQYLHLADKNSLNPSDKFSKVNPLLRMMNESCFGKFFS